MEVRKGNGMEDGRERKRTRETDREEVDYRKRKGQMGNELLLLMDVFKTTACVILSNSRHINQQCVQPKKLSRRV